jgi:hypothetical protein
LTPYAYDSEKHAEFAPTIMFHYLDYMDEKWSASWTAGLGINFNTDINNGIAPLVFAGRSFIYHQNIGLSIGLAAHMLNGLKGNFDISTPISTNLETGDITEKHIGINPFVSITFRFSSSPFTKKAASDSVLQPAH